MRRRSGEFFGQEKRWMDLRDPGWKTAEAGEGSLFLKLVRIAHSQIRDTHTGGTLRTTCVHE
jgi:hypothetical protein